MLPSKLTGITYEHSSLGVDHDIAGAGEQRRSERLPLGSRTTDETSRLQYETEFVKPEERGREQATSRTSGLRQSTTSGLPQPMAAATTAAASGPANFTI